MCEGSRERGRELFESRKERQQRPTTTIAIMLHAPVNKQVKNLPSPSREEVTREHVCISLVEGRRKVQLCIDP